MKIPEFREFRSVTISGTMYRIGATATGILRKLYSGRPPKTELDDAIAAIDAAPRGQKMTTAEEWAQKLGVEPESILKARQRRK